MGSLKRVRVLLDTHIWLWGLQDRSLIPGKLVKILDDESTELWLSPVSIWEVLVLAEKKRIELKKDPLVWIREALNQSPLREAPLNTEVAIRSRQIQLSHQDPADRFIAATALVYELKLATLDQRLLENKEVSILEVIPQFHPSQKKSERDFR